MRREVMKVACLKAVCGEGMVSVPMTQAAVLTLIVLTAINVVMDAGSA